MKQPTKILFMLLVTFILTISCRQVEKLDELREEADEVLVTYPKTRYKRAIMYIPEGANFNLGEYQVLINKLSVQIPEYTEFNYTFIPAPAVDPEREGDTPLWAALREDIGTLIMPRFNSRLSDKDLRALELFVLLGGRIIASSPEGVAGFGANQLAELFGMNMPNEVFPIEEPLYLSGDDGVEPSLVMEVEEGYFGDNFHEFDQLNMLQPHHIELLEAPELFELAPIARRVGNPNLITVARATSTLRLNQGFGSFTLIGDPSLMEGQTGSTGTSETDEENIYPQPEAFLGRLATSGNFKFVLNTIRHAGSSRADDVNPEINIEFEASYPTGSTILPNGEFEDVGGVARVSYRLNNGVDIIVFDAFNNPSDRPMVDRRLLGRSVLSINEVDLNRGENRLVVTAVDQALNESTREFTFIYNIRPTGRRIEISSTQPNSDQVDYNMGIELRGPTVAYLNQDFGDNKLTTSMWDGNRLGGRCAEYEGDVLTAYTTGSSASAGAGRVKSMSGMRRTEAALNRLGNFASLITFNFGDLIMHPRITKEDQGERRYYANRAGSVFEIRFRGIPIIQAPMAGVRIVLEHNASGNCNDDIINFKSGLIYARDMQRVDGLGAVEMSVANGLLADIGRDGYIRIDGKIYNRIIHDSNSDAWTEQGALRFQLGVDHPDPVLVGFQGYSRIGIYR